MPAVLPGDIRPRGESAIWTSQRWQIIDMTESNQQTKKAAIHEVRAPSWANFSQSSSSSFCAICPSSCLEHRQLPLMATGASGYNEQRQSNSLVQVGTTSARGPGQSLPSRTEGVNEVEPYTLVHPQCTYSRSPEENYVQKYVHIPNFCLPESGD